jgi:hypothetical protein
LRKPAFFDPPAKAVERAENDILFIGSPARTALQATSGQSDQAGEVSLPKLRDYVSVP